MGHPLKYRASPLKYSALTLYLVGPQGSTGSYRLGCPILPRLLCAAFVARTGLKNHVHNVKYEAIRSFHDIFVVLQITVLSKASPILKGCDTTSSTPKCGFPPFLGICRPGIARNLTQNSRVVVDDSRIVTYHCT